ncbi:MAG: hypothetical protein CES88_10065 [Halobacteriovorax sp. JY17]|nr:MAG: hypothetical protein CES88_10065 [Halobacteriovorax sp. JY17]
MKVLANKSFHFLILLGISLLIPFENLFVAFFYFLGTWLILLNPYSLFFLYSTALCGNKVSFDRDFMLVGFLILGFLISGLFNDSEYDSVLAMVLFFAMQFLAAKEIARHDLIIKCFVWAIGVYSVLILGSYIHYNYLIYFRSNFDFVSLEHLLIYNRFIESLPSEVTVNSKFHMLVGNTNKASNIYTLCGLLVSFLYMNKKLSKLQVVLVLMSICLVQLVLFSRAAMLMLFAIGAALCVFYSFKGVNRQKVLLFLCIPFLVSISTPMFRDYWTNMSTLNLRFLQQKKVVQFKAEEYKEKRLGELFLGMGPGGYGLKYYKSRDAGTHNFFIDIYLAGGIVSLVSIVLLFLSMIKRTYLHKEVLNKTFFTSVLVVVFVLAFREMNFLYLYRLGQFGFLFYLFYFVAIRDNDHILTIS